MAPSLTVTSETFAELVPEWGALVADAGGLSVFATPTWQATWFEHFGAGADLNLLAVREDGTLRGVVPLMCRDGVMSYLGGTDLVDLHEIPCTLAPEVIIGAAAEQLMRQPNWQRLALLSMRGDEPTVQAWVDALTCAGLAPVVSPEDVVPVVALPSDWPTYVAGLTRHDRHELRRKMRRLDAAGTVEQRIHREPDAVAEHLPGLFALMRASRKAEKANFLTVARASFITTVAARLAAKGQARVTQLCMGGHCLASSLVFTRGGRHEAYNAGFDRAYASLSTGLLNHAFAIRRAIEEGAKSFDFLRGAEPYKKHLGAVARPLLQLTVERPTS